MRRICVFCGSSSGRDPVFAQAARDLGRELASRSLGLVYGGGNIGLMGILANTALEHSAEVIGVIPQSLVDRELAHHGVSELRTVASMHERKALMAELSDAFVALPGGFGTLDEFCEILTWAQLGFHDKACGLLNVSGFFDPFLAQIDHATAANFITPEHRALIRVATEPDRLLQQITGIHPRLPAARP